MAKNTKQENKNNTKSNGSSHQYFNLDDDKAIFEEVDEELRNEKRSEGAYLDADYETEE